MCVFTVPDFPVALDGQFAGAFIKHQAEKHFVTAFQNYVNRNCMAYMNTFFGYMLLILRTKAPVCGLQLQAPLLKLPLQR
jgi:hypothetical protein